MNPKHLSHSGVRGLAVLALAAVVPVAGCGIDPAEIPVPGATVSGPTYEVHIQFANALNLPAQAKVEANGARIGTLRSVSVVDPSAQGAGRIDAVVEISSSVKLPVTTTAQLRQNTILGDIFIGLTTPTGDFGTPIAPGGTIALAQTKPALQVEDLLAGMSTFVGGGALHQVQEIINQTNAVLPQQPVDTAHIFGTLGRDVTDTAADLDSVDRFLTAVQSDLGAVLDNPQQLGELLSARGSVEIPADANSLVQTLGVVGGLGIIGHAVEWLGPLLSAGSVTAKAFVPMLLGNTPLDLNSPSNLSRLVTLLQDKIIPFVEKGPKVNITRVEGGPGDQVNAILGVLRMLGVVR